MADNTITIIGNVTRDPELRYTPSNQSVTTFGVAVNRRWQNRQNQEWEESTSFFDVVCWGTLAENAADSLAKGTRIIVNGRLEQRSWETQDGEKRSKIEVVADEIGPSLRWATAKAEKTDRRNGQQSGPSRNPASQGGPAAQSGGGDYGAAPAPVGNFHEDEEPF
jgi:single-strand DNA-binding protein